MWLLVTTKWMETTKRRIVLYQKVTYAAFMEKVVENSRLFRERGQRERSSGRTVRLLQTGWIITLIIQPVVIVETWRRVINCLCKCEFPWGRWRPPTQGEEKHAHDPIKNNHDPATYSIRAEPRAHAHAVFKKAPQVLSWHDRCW